MVYILSIASFTLQWPSEIVTTESICPVERETFSIWPFTESLLTLGLDHR